MKNNVEASIRMGDLFWNPAKFKYRLKSASSRSEKFNFKFNFKKIHVRTYEVATNKQTNKQTNKKTNKQTNEVLNLNYCKISE